MVRPSNPTPEVIEAVSDVIGRPDSWTPRSGGFSSAGLWTVEVGSERHFVKAATTEDTAKFLRDEAWVLAEVNASCMPEVCEFIDVDPMPVLILEDLSHGEWPPPWSHERIRSVFDTLEEVRETDASSLAAADRYLATDDHWALVDSNMESAAALGVVSQDWLTEAIPVFAEAADNAVLSGDELVHMDVRSDNLCFAERTVLVDWNWASVGNGDVDIVAWLPTLHLEGGPPPWELVSGLTNIAAALAGFFLDHATKPRNPQVRKDIRSFQRDQARVLLEWVARDLGWPLPDGDAQ